MTGIRVCHKVKMYLKCYKKSTREGKIMYGTIWALLPPVVAIVLALITKEVYSSLFIGIVTGALIYTGFSPIATLDTVINEGFINSVADAWNIGIFMLADNRMLQLILRNSHIYHTIAELFMMLITIPLFLYLGKMYTEYSPVMVQTVCLISVMDFSIRFCLNLTGLKDFHESLRLTHITFGILIALVIYAIGKGFYQNQRQHLKHNLYHNLGILCLCFGVLLDILLLWFGSAPETSFFTRIGVLMFLIMEAVQVTLRLMTNYQEGVRMQLLSRLAYRDGLTDLLNRTSYMEELKRLDASHNFHVLLALYDVNSLKYVNDTYGHQSGDKLICRVADTLSAHLGSLGKCYRIGGDEFVFLSTVSDSEKEFLKLQRDFEASLGTLKLPDGSEHPITVAMGYSVLTHNMPRSMDDMVREADAKMYEAKRRMKTEN